MIRRADVAIIGAGMAGASLAAEIASHASVLLIEAESQPGYHATGRSAAFWSETYGGPHIQPLTTASGPFLAQPPMDFSERSFLRPRGAVHLADQAGLAALEAMQAEFENSRVTLLPLDRRALEARIAGLKPNWLAGLWEPSCADIDVAALHAAYLKAARRAGARLVLDARLEAAARSSQGWRLATRQGPFECEILVNAAGAWADEVALLAGQAPIGIQPYRRTIAQLRIAPPAPADLPLVVDLSGRFYFKPEAGGRLWLSPHDETPCPPCDSAAEEQDLALAIDRLDGVVDWRVEHVEHRWAGLRSFAPDRLPVFGFARGSQGFFWCAGQGGFGIQTAPAAARLAAALLLGRAGDPMLAGIDAELYRADRFMN
jgi:D-arginine dehydrogenase